MIRQTSDSTTNSSISTMDANDWENHLIIRFPPEIASNIKHFVEQDTHQTGRERLSINFDHNLRTGNVQFDRNSMRFTLQDLPCIIEMMKTLDNKTIYKVVDVCQMIVAHPHGATEKARKRDRSVDTADSNRQDKYQWPHGLCPPLKNVRRKRFRKIKRKKYMDVADVERELKRLLRSDLDAVSVRWEVVSAEAEVDEAEKHTMHEQEEPVPSQQQADDTYEYGLSLSESEDDEQSNF